ncbi:phosphotransferase [Pseudalkalibacillus berkeleyi]|uniref:Phosphotransferase n=1 Tax=Pseudalkalibacillus berkeleyi TaxID=1069813 RepID=A0ABS9H1I6_9BACL|nr:phosphotransferase [Pseudalkalibacillus berkeleyi]MCF6137820.1 phosphotransferase [Pseudalkalibacillus berkeleyi]
MSDLQSIIKKMCENAQLGELNEAPKKILGGLLHQMYAVDTAKGKYAVKILNPQIMRRPTALKNYIHSEQIAEIASTRIPALPAKKLNGTFVQELDNHCYLVFDWIEGNCLKPNEISKDHCEKIGEIVADIHQTDFSELGIKQERILENEHLTDWNIYLQKGRENHADWFTLLKENSDRLFEWNAMAIEAAKLLSSKMVISHRDLDSKNVIWNHGAPVLIDWESAGYINPMHDLMETAMYWTKSGNGNIDKAKFFVFINGYKKRFGMLNANWNVVLAMGFLSKLGWLEYNLKRSLWIECTNESEQKVGSSQVIETLDDLNRYAETIPKIKQWLK